MRDDVRQHEEVASGHSSDGQTVQAPVGSSDGAAGSAARKAYSKPALRYLGSVRELTLGGSGQFPETGALNQKTFM